ncbi:MAG: iron ABC transporter permease [Bacilli bacterium]|nr:iron ABC transporter permease [Bacilli bacterium]
MEHVNPKFKRFLRNLKTFFSNPSNTILVIFAILLTVMVIYPLITLFLDAFTVHSIREASDINDTMGTSLKKGDFTLAHWPLLLFNKETEGFSSTSFWIPLYQSVLMSVIACLVAVLGGGVIAWFITRTNIPCKKFISTVFVFPYIMPSWSIAMFWENFFKNSQITACYNQVGMLESLTGICVPESLLYGFWPCALVLGIHYMPFAYILIGGILRNMDANLEEAATILKSSRFKILRRITLPIVAPALISTILLVFASSISSYTVPAFLNANGSFNAISIQMRSMLTSGQKGKGYVIAVILLVFSMLILTLNNWFTKSRRNFTTVSGKSGQISKANLGKFKWVFSTVLIVFVSFIAIVPLITFVLESLCENSGDLSTLTLRYWISDEDFDVRITSQLQSSKGIFHNFTIWQAFGRSIIVAVVVALIAGTFGILIGYAVSKNRRGRLSNFVSSLAFLPYLIPALSFGAVFFALISTPAFNKLNVASTNQQWSAIVICIIAGSIKFLPFASRSGTNAMLQLSGEIEEAAIITGCPWGKRMTKILFPIQKSSFISGYLLPFISCMRELTLFTLLTNSFTLITNTIQFYDIYGMGQITNGINLLIVLFVIGANLLVNAVTGASIDKGIGG